MGGIIFPGSHRQSANTYHHEEGNDDMRIQMAKRAKARQGSTQERTGMKAKKG
jgi:hypothetical protein